MSDKSKKTGEPDAENGLARMIKFPGPSRQEKLLPTDQLETVFNEAMAALEKAMSREAPLDPELARVAVESFTNWAKEVCEAGDERDKIRIAYTRLDVKLERGENQNPVVKALHSQLMLASRYCEYVAFKVVPLRIIRMTLEQALRTASQCEAAVLEEVQRIGSLVEAVLQPEDGLPACFSGHETAECPPLRPGASSVNVGLGANPNEEPDDFNN